MTPEHDELISYASIATLAYGDPAIQQQLERQIADAAIQELSTETDEHLALRKALLTIILLTQDHAPEPASNFIRHLLTEFSPLTKHFADHPDDPRLHPFLGDETVLRGSPADSAHLGIRTDFAESLLPQAAPVPSSS